MQFPQQVDGCRVRKLSDGSYWVPRASEESLAVLAKTFPRAGNKPIFYDPVDFPKYVEQLRSYFENEKIVLVGKGPSLETYHPNPRTKHLFINDSISYFYGFPVTDTGVTQTSTLGYVIVQDRLPIPYPDEYIITTAIRKNIHPNSYLIVPELYGLTSSTPTAILAIAMLKDFKVSEIILVGFDAFRNGNVTYAKGFDHKGLEPSRFLAFNTKIKEMLQGIKYSFY